MTTDNRFLDQEVRIRVLETLSTDIKTELKHIDQKMDSQFKWIIGTLLGMFLTTSCLILGSIILTKMT